MSPAAAAAEETVAAGRRSCSGCRPAPASGFVTGAQMANATALAAARNAVLARAGWDVEARGLIGAPAGARDHERRVARDRVQRAAPARPRARHARCASTSTARAGCAPDALAAALAAGDGPAIVCAQAGNVNTGAFDPFEEVVAACRAAGAWCHVDGAFGLWAAAAPGRAHLAAGAAGADSWAVDAHKWLNVPYDSALAIVADPAPLTAAMALTAAYLTTAGERERNGADWAPEASRRARAFPLWAALRQLGRSGVAELVERHCVLAARIAERLAAEPGVEILNDVVLNQALVRFGDDDAATNAVIAARAAGGHVLARRHGLAGPRGDARLGLGLADDGGRRRPLRGGDRGGVARPPRRIGSGAC